MSQEEEEKKKIVYLLTKLSWKFGSSEQGDYPMTLLASLSGSHPCNTSLKILIKKEREKNKIKFRSFDMSLFCRSYIFPLIFLSYFCFPVVEN